MREYSKFETAIANIPYVAMILMGVVTIAYAHAFSAYGLAGAVSYLAYGVVGAFWIMDLCMPVLPILRHHRMSVRLLNDIGENREKGEPRPLRAEIQTPYTHDRSPMDHTRCLRWNRIVALLFMVTAWSRLGFCR